MTGGTIPAMIWHNIMAYAHQGIELRPLPGLPPPEHAPTGRQCRAARRARAAADPADAQGAPKRWSMSSICSTTPVTRLAAARRAAGTLGALGERGTHPDGGERAAGSHRTQRQLDNPVAAIDRIERASVSSAPALP